MAVSRSGHSVQCALRNHDNEPPGTTSVCAADFRTRQVFCTRSGRDSNHSGAGGPRPVQGPRPAPSMVRTGIGGRYKMGLFDIATGNPTSGQEGLVGEGRMASNRLMGL